MSQGWSQPELAERVELSRWTIANVESHDKGLSLETLARFHSLGLDLNWLITGVGTPPD